jgi:hypothetical protein
MLAADGIAHVGTLRLGRDTGWRADALTPRRRIRVGQPRPCAEMAHRIEDRACVM